MTSEKDIFCTDSCLDKEEKLFLFDFAACEFDLKHFLPLSGPNLITIAKFSLLEFSRNNTNTDFIYFNLTNNSEFDFSIAKKLLKFISKKGIICVDGLDCVEKFRPIFKGTFEPILEVPGFSVFARSDGARSISSMHYQMDLFRRKYFFEQERKIRCPRPDHPQLVTVIILTYKHENYIAKCLNSVLSQAGKFRMRIIIIDDASSDSTAKIVRNIISEQLNDHVEIELIVNKSNCGVVKNLATAVRLAVGCDYLTFCEGDDFWSSVTRIQEHLDFLAINHECVMSFNAMDICSSDGSSRKIHVEHVQLTQEIIDGNSLAACNLIGNFSTCFYRGAIANIVPEKLFDMYTVDWMFNLYCSQFGTIGHLRKSLSVYRQHEGGEWSNRQEWDKTIKLLKLIDQYNIFLDYQYDEGLQKYKKSLLELMSIKYKEMIEKFDILIFDDVFPAPCSGFRFAEFTAYLAEFPRSMILTSGVSLFVVGDELLHGVIQKFQRRYPHFGNQVMESTGTFPVRLGKLLYVNFLANVYALLSVAEEAKVPFAFTLYPGGGFVLNNSECDCKLKRIFDSPCFLKVIVTQQITYDYLISNGLCPSEKIELIFGVVMPQDAFVDPIPKDKARWGFGKQRLDICFMAHRYTPHGEDKGYDVFINAACRLRKMHDDIYFHVVGPYDRRVIDVSPIRDRIEFYGTLDPEQLDNFFKDMDIIMSPNISGKIWPGSFDGFPTASCTEGGLRGVAIFCTDEFNSAEGRLVDGQDLVLISYDLTHIVSKVDHYYRKPKDLKAIGECGSRRILDLYSYQSQMSSRVRILRELIESPFVFDVKKMRGFKPCSPASTANPLNVVSTPLPSPTWKWLKKYSPDSLKMFYRKFIKRHVRSNHV